MFPWAASGRSLTINRSEGLTKLLFEPGTKRLLGGGIVGTNAGELIAEITLSPAEREERDRARAEAARKAARAAYIAVATPLSTGAMPAPYSPSQPFALQPRDVATYPAIIERQPRYARFSSAANGPAAMSERNKPLTNILPNSSFTKPDASA